MIKITLRIICLLAVVYGAWVGGLYIAQRHIIYAASPTKPDLASANIQGMREITFRTEDGLSLFAWYKAAEPKEKKTIVWLHGNGSNVAWSAWRALPYMQAGYGVLLVEYRGYCANPGRPSEEGLYSDARGALSWLKAHDIYPTDIVLYGESIGSGPAIQMAIENPRVSALVLEAPFTSITEVAHRLYPIVPTYIVKDRYDNLSKIGLVRSPVIVAHGTQDSVIPYEMGQAVYDAAPQPKTFISVEGGDHNNLLEFNVGTKILSALSE